MRHFVSVGLGEDARHEIGLFESVGSVGSSDGSKLFFFYRLIMLVAIDFF